MSRCFYELLFRSDYLKANRSYHERSASGVASRRCSLAKRRLNVQMYYTWVCRTQSNQSPLSGTNLAACCAVAHLKNRLDRLWWTKGERGILLGAKSTERRRPTSDATGANNVRKKSSRTRRNMFAEVAQKIRTSFRARLSSRCRVDFTPIRYFYRDISRRSRYFSRKFQHIDCLIFYWYIFFYSRIIKIAYEKLIWFICGIYSIKTHTHRLKYSNAKSFCNRNK